ncbi:hypothetical protein [Brucella sp. 10RB9210]|uniref:hypothetical protein n=1 Tax=Brucella sp. 10RB9210 TaxID=1844037 RepID=UPI0012AE0ED1|nr:hypothetical protein [Brucella sp. 10RB9210]MRN79471.1 hypothetical protein [Brucella sp. 10RB9210]
MVDEKIEALAKEFAGDILDAYDSLETISLAEVREGLEAEGWDKQKATEFIQALDLIANRTVLTSMKIKQAFAL